MLGLKLGLRCMLGLKLESRGIKSDYCFGVVYNGGALSVGKG